MLFTNGLLTNDVLRWKAIGAAAWLAAITVAAAAAWSTAAAPSALLSPLGLLRSLFSPSGWLTTTALVVAQAPAFAAQTACLRGAEPRPPHINRLPLPRAAAGPLAVLLSKLAVRVGSVAGATRAAVFLGLHTLSAVLSLSLDSATRASAPQGASWTLQYSLWLAATFLLHYVYWSQDVAQFPSIQRHRYFRLKQRLPGTAAAAAKLAAAAFGGAAATAALRASALGAAAAWPPTLGGSVAALLAGALCTFCWLMAAATLEVVLTERLRPDDYSDRDVGAAQAACLKGARGELMQALALHDASRLASDVGKAALRRSDIFADESGDRWRPVGAACIAELDTLATAVAAALPQQKPAAPAAGAAGTGAGGAASGATQSQHRWNVLPSALSKKAGLGSSRPQVEALLVARCSYPRAALAADALTGFAVASLKEDRFGVLQLTQPGLGEVLLCLLGALGATQHLMRASASLAPRQLTLGPWRCDGSAAPFASCYASPPLDAVTLALQDVLTVSLYRLAATFGDGLTKVLAECKGKPAFGSAGEAAALLQQFLRGQA